MNTVTISIEEYDRLREIEINLNKSKPVPKLKQKIEEYEKEILKANRKMEEYYRELSSAKNKVVLMESIIRNNNIDKEKLNCQELKQLQKIERLEQHIINLC